MQEHRKPCYNAVSVGNDASIKAKRKPCKARLSPQAKAKQSQALELSTYGSDRDRTIGKNAYMVPDGISHASNAKQLPSIAKV